MRQKNENPGQVVTAAIVNGRLIRRRFFLFISLLSKHFDFDKDHVPVFPIKWFGLMVCLLFTVFQESFSQTGRVTKNNYTGDWETPESWDPVWDTPQTDSIDVNITINGYISRNGPLTFSGGADTLFVNDTLIVYGDLTLGNLNNLIVNNNGILIVHGNLNAGNKTNIEANAYVVVTGNFTKLGDVNHGSFLSNDIPAKVFIGGTVQPGLDTVLFPVFKCPGNFPYDSSNCSYGNMADILNDPVNSFFQSTCSPVNITSSNTPLCVNETRALTGNTAGGIFTVKSGPGSISGDVLTAADSGIIIIEYTDTGGCFNSDSQSITVNRLPVPGISIIANSGVANNDGIICSGDSATLTATG